MQVRYLIKIASVTLLINFAMLCVSSSAATPIKPCSDPNHRQFDFWIGEWVVKDAQGNKVGSNKIFSILDGCALSENWEDAKGNPGVSYNFYDRSRKRWHQTWIDSSGSALYLDGQFENNKMVMNGKQTTKDNQLILHRITWMPMEKGVVKQHWQSSNDRGEKWKDVFVGFYHKDR